MEMVVESIPFATNVEGFALGKLLNVVVTEEPNRLDNYDSAFEVFHVRSHEQVYFEKVEQKAIKKTKNEQAVTPE